MKHHSSALARGTRPLGLRHRVKSIIQACTSFVSRTGAQLVTLVAATLLVVGAMSATSRQGPVSSVGDPGPTGSFTWKGFNWEKRAWNGPPQFNELFDEQNVSDPDANGYVTLTVSNPTGGEPSGAEFRSTRRGFGYGTYTTTVEKNINELQKELVWGCLYTYDPSGAPGFTEIDLCEASAWGGGGKYGLSWPVTQGHGYWVDATKPSGDGNKKVDFEVFDSRVLTHKMIWEPGKLTYETYSGEGSGHRLVRRTVLEGSSVPRPANEAVHFNLWVIAGGGGSPESVKRETVIVRDFSFTPAASKD